MGYETVSMDEHRKAVRASTQLGEFRKIKKSHLPVIKEDFDVDELISKGLCEKAENLVKSVQAYLDLVVKYHSRSYGNDGRVSRNAHAEAVRARSREKAEKEITKIRDIILQVRDRCVHSLAFPELYLNLSEKALSELYLYWKTVAEMDANPWFEYYTIAKGFSSFPMLRQRTSLETVMLEYEFFSLLRRFSNVYQFVSEEEATIFSLFLEGFEPIVIAETIGETEEFIQSKLNSFIKIAVANRDRFFQQSVNELTETTKEDNKDFWLRMGLDENGEEVISVSVGNNSC